MIVARASRSVEVDHAGLKIYHVALMKPTAQGIIVPRVGIVHQDALLEALQDNRVA
jgi:phosphoglycerate dehydrogenase-like enzyme